MPFDGSEYVARPCRSLPEMRAEIIDRLKQIGGLKATLVLRWIADRGSADELCRRLRQLNREVCSLGRRLAIVESELAMRQRAA